MCTPCDGVEVGWLGVSTTADSQLVPAPSIASHRYTEAIVMNSNDTYEKFTPDH